MTAEPLKAGKPGLSARDAARILLIVALLWLGWEVVKSALAARGAPALAVSVAADSPEALGRAAEAELVADRVENAAALANQSLTRAPFNVRALRVRGLVEARLGRTDEADEMLTLAGNWSLRDDPAHAWLIVNRLERGDYASAFAHADTLARRRPDARPSVFNLLTAAVIQDARALPVVARLVAANPPWRPAFLDHLLSEDDGARVIGGLAPALQPTDAPFTTAELEQIYNSWLTQRRFDGVRRLRAQLLPPNADDFLQNGDFSIDVDDQLQPFGWAMGFGPGIVSMIAEEDLSPENQALRLEYDGFATGVLARQLLILPPGPHVLTGRWRAETPRAALPLDWQVICVDTGLPAGADRTRLSADSADWRALTFRFDVPRQNCSAQWLQISGLPGDRRTTTVAWFDDLRVRPTSSAASDGEVANAR